MHKYHQLDVVRFVSGEHLISHLWYAVIVACAGVSALSDSNIFIRFEKFPWRWKVERRVKVWRRVIVDVVSLWFGLIKGAIGGESNPALPEKKNERPLHPEALRRLGSPPLSGRRLAKQYRPGYGYAPLFMIRRGVKDSVGHVAAFCGKFAAGNL